MEIKYTIEILTKDIQDIEKLLGNLGNSKGASAIELDLAMSKLRNVYEILTLIKADRLHEMVSDIPEPETKPQPEKEPEPKSEPEQKTEPEPVQKTEPEPVQKTEPEPVQKTEPITETETDSKPAHSSILAEKFSAESSINENLAGKIAGDRDVKLVGKPIENISRNIGINDRFLIIRELFDGEAERFTSLVNALDSAENYEDASSILKEELSDFMDHEGMGILTGLVKRKYIR